MRVLVTGAAGFIGSHLCDELVRQEHDVVGVDCFHGYYSRGLKEQNLQPLLAMRNFVFHEADLRSSPLEAIVDGCDAVVNEAALPGLVRSWTDLADYTSCNLLGLGRLADACVKVGIQAFVQASTSSVYGALAIGDEDQETRPSSPYGVTKLAAELLLRAYHSQLALPIKVLRYFSIYGPRQRPDMAYNIFIDALSRGEPIRMYGDGSQSRSNTFVSDCIAGTIAALHAGQIGATYNIGGGQRITLLQAVEIIGEILDRTPNIIHLAPRLGDQEHTSADTSRAQMELGYSPMVAPHDGLAAQVQWQLTAPR